jgi:hypothetical protein
VTDHETKPRYSPVSGLSETSDLRQRRFTQRSHTARGLSHLLVHTRSLSVIARAQRPRPLVRAGALLGRAVIWFVLLATLAGLASAVLQHLPTDLMKASGGFDWGTVGLLAGATAIVFALCQAFTSPLRNEAERRDADSGSQSQLRDNG